MEFRDKMMLHCFREVNVSKVQSRNLILGIQCFKILLVR